MVELENNVNSRGYLALKSGQARMLLLSGVLCQMVFWAWNYSTARGSSKTNVSFPRAHSRSGIFTSFLNSNPRSGGIAVRFLRGA